MEIFWRLTAYEYKKALCRKTAVMAVIIAVIICAASVCGAIIGDVYDRNGNFICTRYEDMQKDIRHARSLSGRPIDSELIMEAAEAYGKVPTDGSVSYTDTDEYELYARKYSEIYGIARTVFNTDEERFDVKSFQSLTKEQADSFYELRRAKQEDAVRKSVMSDKAKEDVLAADKNVEKPIVFKNTNGYQRFAAIMYTTAIISALASAIVFAPIFSGEYSSGADSLILSSKHGRGLLIGAKLFTVFTVSAALTLFMTALNYAECMLIFGSDGADGAIQLLFPMASYPLTMGQSAAIYSVGILAACLMSAAITAALSARVGTSFGTVIIMAAILIAPMFFNVDTRIPFVNALFDMLPSNIMAFGFMFSDTQYELFGAVIRPYVFLPVSAAAFAVLFAAAAYRVFKRRNDR